MQEVSLLLASQEGLSSMELINLYENVIM